MSFIAGRYTCTYNSLSLGQTADGWRPTWSFFKRLITGDAWAQAPQDAVYQGAEMLLGGRLIEYDAAGVATASWPYNGTKWTMGVVGRTDVGSSLVKSIVLTAVAGTPAAATPATMTFSKSILQEGFPIEILFAPDLREVPLRFRVYPDQSTGVFATET